jgi:hypothetical protein
MKNLFRQLASGNDSDNHTLFLVFCLWLLWHSGLLFAQNVESVHPTRSTLFIENKGQIGDQRGRPNNNVRFLMRYGSLVIQLRHNGFSYDQYTQSVDSDSMWTINRIDVDFENPSPKLHIVASNASPDYTHYFNHITAQSVGDKGATYVRGFATVTYHDVWPGVDMIWSIGHDGKPRYRWNVHTSNPGTRISLRFGGGSFVSHAAIVAKATSKPRIERTAMGLEKPFSGTRWGTYIGGSASNRALAVATTPAGDVVVAGLSMADATMATAGAYQSEVLGETWDAFVTVLSSDGSQRRWGTFLGGGMSDVATGVAVLNNGDIVVAGETQSSTGISTGGSHQSGFGGAVDGFITVLSADGSMRRWGTYVGGSERDGITSVRVMPSNGIAVGGSTQSAAGIATAGTHQIGNAGATDGFVAAFTSQGQRLWGSYLGGVGTDEVTCLSARNGRIIVGGTTGSRTNIATVGAVQGSYGGGTEDGFVAVLDGMSGQRQWASYVGGEGFDVVLGVDELPNGDIVVGGETRSTSGIASDGAVQPTNSGGRGDGFVGVLHANGTERRWMTYIGGSQVDGVYGVTVMGTGDIVLVGRTASTSGIAHSTSSQPTLAGGEDGFIAAMRANGSEITYGAYIGGTGNDAATAVVSPTTGSAIVVGRTTSNNGIGTSGSYQSMAGGEFDAFCIGYSDLPVGVSNQITNEHTILIWPQPASNHIYVKLEHGGPTKLSLYSQIGHLVVSAQIRESQLAETNTHLDVQHLPTGLYVLQIHTPKQVFSRVITIAR